MDEYEIKPVICTHNPVADMTPPERLQDVTLGERLAEVVAEMRLRVVNCRVDEANLVTYAPAKLAPFITAWADRIEAAAALSGEVDATFAEWLATEMPAGTVISDPAWWANRIARQYAKRATPQSVVPQWQPIETAPKDGARIILGRPDIDGDGGVSVLGYWIDALDDGVDYMGHDGGFTDSDYQVFNPGRSFGNPDYRHVGSQPTHWQPLPATPPSEG